MNKKIKQTEPYSAPTVKVLALEARRTVMQTSPSGDNPGAWGHDFGEPIDE